MAPKKQLKGNASHEPKRKLSAKMKPTKSPPSKRQKIEEMVSSDNVKSVEVKDQPCTEAESSQSKRKRSKEKVRIAKSPKSPKSPPSKRQKKEEIASSGNIQSVEIEDQPCTETASSESKRKRSKEKVRIAKSPKSPTKSSKSAPSKRQKKEEIASCGNIQSVEIEDQPCTEAASSQSKRKRSKEKLSVFKSPKSPAHKKPKVHVKASNDDDDDDDVEMSCEDDEHCGRMGSCDQSASVKGGSSFSPHRSKAQNVRETYNFKISSWNINGIRAWLQKSGLDFFQKEKPDILCLQETKCSDDKLPSDVKNLDGYYCYWTSGDKAGYAGVGLLSKIQPTEVTYGIGIEEFDQEGRAITAEYENFFVVTAYVPNSGRGLVRLDYRMSWDREFFSYLKKLSKKKEVILCGDLNVSHQEIDLANPSSNRKNAGFTKEERESFETLLDDEFVDTFRYLYPDVKGVYSFWTYMRNARANNIGWRLDYFVCSKGLCSHFHDSVIHTDIMGSDHCPISLLLEL